MGIKAKLYRQAIVLNRPLRQGYNNRALNLDSGLHCIGCIMRDLN